MTTTRIRWEDNEARWDDNGSILGYVGTRDEWLFRITEANDDTDDETLALASRLPGEDRTGTSPEKLKAEAERWLEEFVTSLGAVFPEEPARPSRAWHADWAEVDRDQDGNAILKHKPDGGLYRILPVEEC